MGHSIPSARDPRLARGRRRHVRDGRSRFGRYRSDFHDEWEYEEAQRGYWSLVRRPLPSLVFTLPFVVAYEVGVVQLGGGAPDALRTGIDRWVREALAGVGPELGYLLPLGLLGLLIFWMVVDGPRTWRFRATWLPGMCLESLVLGAALIGLSRLVDRGLGWLEGEPIRLAVGVGGSEFADTLAPWLSFLGAGVYEEAVFRLALIPVLYWSLRIVQAPEVLAGTLAVTVSALAFSMAHHAGVPGEAFTWYAFLFRWLAGVVFAWVFLVRGFGIAVGAHVAYDLLAVSADWSG